MTLGALHRDQTAVMLLVFKQPGANVIDTVDNIKAALTQLRSLIPPGIHLDTIVDRTQTIRASVKDVEFTLLLSCALVVLVILLFLRSIQATLIPGAAVPLSLLGATAMIYLLGFSLDNLSLMALTIAVGFVVDDAIVVVENIFRHLEAGTTPLQSAIKGAREIGFTVISISISLIAVFIPLLLMSGIVGRLFHEFAITVTAAIVVSVVVSLTLTPMLCSRFLVSEHDREHGRLYRAIEWGFDTMLDGYRRGLDFVLRHQFPTLLVFLATVCITGVMFVPIPKGFFPTQDIGMILGISEAGQDVSPDKMRDIQRQLSAVIAQRPRRRRLRIVLRPELRQYAKYRPLHHRSEAARRPHASASQIIDRLRPQLAKVPGARLFLQPAQDITVGGRIARGQFQYVLQDPDLHELNTWAPRLLRQAQDAARAGRRRQRCAERGAAAHNQHQSRCGRPFRHSAAAHRRHAQRRLRPAPGDAVFHQQFLLSRARSAARAAGERADAQSDLRQGADQRAARAAVDPGQRRHRRISGRCWSPIPGNSRR